MKIIHLLSGGLDSTVMLYDLKQQGHEIHCLLFDYKQKHVQELTFAKLHCRKLNVPFTTIDLPQIGGSMLTDGIGSVIVPNRNSILISLAVSVAVKEKSQAVSFACNADDAEMFPDCRDEFVNAISYAVMAAGYKIEIMVPYIAWTKKEIARLGKMLMVPINETWSCYQGGANPCGECEACKKREAALCGL